MKFIIIIKYFYPGHSIGLEDVRNAWLISDNETPVQFKTAIHQEHYITGCRYQESESVTGLLKKGW